MPRARPGNRQLRAMRDMALKDMANCKKQLAIACARGDGQRALYFSHLYAQCVYLEQSLLEQLKSTDANTRIQPRH